MSFRNLELTIVAFNSDLLDRSVKLRRGGNSQNFCVHKHYFDSGSSWKAIRDAENRAKEDSGKAEKTKGDNDADCLQFDPIDTLHLTSLPILRQRILKLLKHSEDGLVPYVNIALRVVRISFYSVASR